MRSLRIIAVLSLLLCLLLTNAVAQTESTAEASTGDRGCLHQTGLVNGPTKATCSSTYRTDYYAESAASAAAADYFGLAVGGGASVSLFNGGAPASASVEAETDLTDYLYPANFPASSFLVAVYGLTANPTGSAGGWINAGVDLQPSGGVSVDCPTISQFGANSCSGQVPINPGDSVKLYAYIGAGAQVDCAPPTCGAAASGFEAGYKKPGGGKILLAVVVDGKGNRINGAKITSASGYEYPSKFASTTKLKSHPNPSTQGQTVKFTATVSSFGRSGASTGKVTFTDTTTGTTLGHTTLKAGVATFTTSALAPGTHAIVASYGGDIWSAQSKSAALNQVVN
jgi:hypothetical protein